MRVLVTNDDGLRATGLAVLERIALALTDDVWVVAPETEQSGAGHSLTLHRPLRARQIDDRHFAVDGTPTDCVMLAINRFVADPKPDLVLSGVNRGCNLADDATYSGTIAAAMEATLLGVPAIALSQHYVGDGPVPYEVAEAHAPDLISRLVAIGWPNGVLINVNFPSVAADAKVDVVVSRLGRHKFGDILTERIDPRGRPYYWIGGMKSRDEEEVPGTDIAAVYQGSISVTPLTLDLTHDPTTDALRRSLA